VGGPSWGDEGQTRPGVLDEGTLQQVAITVSDAGQVHKIGDYQVFGILGRGGMAVVYDARGPDNKSVAVKTIERKWLEAPGSNAMRRFMQEVTTLERLEHPNVVRLHSHGIATHPLGYELAFLVMERLDGKSLGELLRARGKFPVAQVLNVASQVIEALVHLDQHGIVHRDLKPGNVMLRRDGTAVLMDFGLARATDLTRLTKANHVVGTPQYMSPERIYGEEFDIRSDVFALGIIVYEMLTGSRAPEEREDRKLEWPKELEAPASAVTDLVEAMLAPEPDARPTPLELRQWVADIRTIHGEDFVDTVQALPEPPKTSPVRSADTVQLSPGTLADALRGPTEEMLPAPDSVSVEKRRSDPRILWLAFAVAALIALPVSFVGGVKLKRYFSRPAIGQTFGTAREAFQFGDRALKEGRHDAAVIALTRAIELEPSMAEAHRRLADAYLSKGAIQEAKDQYRRYLDLAPDAPDAENIREIFSRP
jgi:serine/threonine protein kinase